MSGLLGFGRALERSCLPASCTTRTLFASMQQCRDTSTSCTPGSRRRPPPRSCSRPQRGDDDAHDQRGRKDGRDTVEGAKDQLADRQPDPQGHLGGVELKRCLEEGNGQHHPQPHKCDCASNCQRPSHQSAWACLPVHIVHAASHGALRYAPATKDTSPAQSLDRTPTPGTPDHGHRGSSPIPHASIRPRGSCARQGTRKIIFGAKAGNVAQMILGCRSRNGSKDVIGSGQRSWTVGDAIDAPPWPRGAISGPGKRRGDGRHSFHNSKVDRSRAGHRRQPLTSATAPISPLYWRRRTSSATSSPGG
jgi:hypothetical protein